MYITPGPGGAVILDQENILDIIKDLSILHYWISCRKISDNKVLDIKTFNYMFYVLRLNMIFQKNN